MKSVANDVMSNNYFMILSTHRGLNKMPDILQMSLPIVFAQLNMTEFWLKNDQVVHNRWITNTSELIEGDGLAPKQKTGHQKAAIRCILQKSVPK